MAESLGDSQLCTPAGSSDWSTREHGAGVEEASLLQPPHPSVLWPGFSLRPPLPTPFPVCCPVSPHLPATPALAASNINRLLSLLPAIQGPAKLVTGIKIV